MRVAFVADVHGNWLALNAVLEDIHRVGVDATFCLGDIATLGPSPRAVLDTLRDFGCVHIMGNHEEMLLDPPLARRYTDAQPILDAIDWCADQLTSDDRQFLRGFMPEAQIDLDGLTALAFHGTPRSNQEDLLATTPPDLVDELLDGRTGAVLISGHTHVQMVRQHRGTILVNAGSVGMPFREYAGGGQPVVMPDRAEYAIVQGGEGKPVTVSLRRLPLDENAVRRAVAAADPPVRALLLGSYP